MLHVVACLTRYTTVQMEAKGYSETWVEFHRVIQHHTAEDIPLS
jgi:hypothetical protein